MCDEIEYSVFYHILQNKFKERYEMALSQCWNICIPCSAALRGIKIDEEFVDLHILKPSVDPTCSTSKFFKSGLGNTYSFKLENKTIELCKAPFHLKEKYIINIIFIENGYNKEFLQYKIFVIDRPLSPEICPLPLEDDTVRLDQKITTWREASVFLSRFSILDLEDDLQFLMTETSLWTSDLEKIEDKIHTILNDHWVKLLQTQPLELQRDVRFQTLLTTALENHILHSLCDVLFPVICHHFQVQDAAVLCQLQELGAKGITADQLGAPEDLSVPLPAAVVELASLDSLTAPIDKLFCLRTTLDLILAEVKGAIIDAQSVLSFEAKLPAVSTDELVPLLMSVIVQAKPLHMFSNLYYIEHFQWTLSPSDAMSYSMVTFKAAVQELISLKESELKPRSNRVHRELGLEELIKVTGEVGEHFDRSGERCPQRSVTPLDRERERFVALIEVSTQDCSPSDT